MQALWLLMRAVLRLHSQAQGVHPVQVSCCTLGGKLLVLQSAKLAVLL